jgi:hypothetical protein
MNTPRTEAADLNALVYGKKVVFKEFAEQLERELTAEKKLTLACVRDCNNTALERNAALDALAAEQEKVKQLREVVSKCRAEFIAMKHMGDKETEMAIADTTRVLAVTK